MAKSKKIVVYDPTSDRQVAINPTPELTAANIYRDKLTDLVIAARVLAEISYRGCERLDYEISPEYDAEIRSIAATINALAIKLTGTDAVVANIGGTPTESELVKLASFLTSVE
jgi:hypothetical protein